MPTVDKHGRPAYPESYDTQPELDAHNAALTAKLAQMEKDADAELAKYPPAPEPKESKSK